jgi:hypothetical protein
VVGGIFTILAGASSIVWFLSGWGNDSIFWEAGLNWCVALGVVLGLIGIVGGVLAMMKRLFGLALVGAICVTLSFGWFGMSFFMGLLAVILVAISKDAFDAPGAQQLPVRY